MHIKLQRNNNSSLAFLSQIVMPKCMALSILHAFSRTIATSTTAFSTSTIQIHPTNATLRPAIRMRNPFRTWLHKTQLAHKQKFSTYPGNITKTDSAISGGKQNS